MTTLNELRKAADALQAENWGILPNTFYVLLEAADDIVRLTAERDSYKADAERTAKENLKLMSLLKDAADDYAQHCEGGESDEWLQAARDAMKGDQP